MPRCVDGGSSLKFVRWCFFHLKNELSSFRAVFVHFLKRIYQLFFAKNAYFEQNFATSSEIAKLYLLEVIISDGSNIGTFNCAIVRI